MPTETWAVANGPGKNGPQQIAFLDDILVLARYPRAGQDSKTIAKQSKASNRGESGGLFLAAGLGEVFVCYAELSAQHQSNR